MIQVAYLKLFFYSQVRECLKLDPEHKECFPHYKKVKKVAKLVQDLQTNSNDNNYQGCITSAKKVFYFELLNSTINNNVTIYIGPESGSHRIRIIIFG